MKYLPSPGDQPLAKEPEDSGYEIEKRQLLRVVL